MALALRLELGLGQGQGVRGVVGVIMVRNWVMYYSNEIPHRHRSTRASGGPVSRVSTIHTFL